MDPIDHRPGFAGRVREDALMPLHEGLHGATDSRLRGGCLIYMTTRSSVREAVGGEEDSGSGEETRRGPVPLFGHCLGLSQADARVNRRMQLHLLVDPSWALGGSCDFGAPAEGSASRHSWWCVRVSSLPGAASARAP